MGKDRLKAYKYQLYPNNRQKEQFAKTFGCVRKVYNLMLNDRKEAYKRTKEDPSQKMIYPTPAQYKKQEEYVYLKDVDSLALANAQLNLDKAYKHFFRDKSVGFPKFKSKGNPVQSYTTNNQKGTVQIVDHKYLKLPKMKDLIRIKLHRQPQGVIKSVTISMTASGKYYASILCKQEIPFLPKTGFVVGIDLGIADFAVLSSGKKVDNNTFTYKMEQTLKREQRKLAKKRNVAKKQNRNLFNCKNYQKQKRKVAKLYEKVKHQRSDFLHKLSTELIQNHDVICIEDLNSKGMLRNHKLAKSISDVSWSTFVNHLTYKAEWYEKKITKVDRWFPSSQLCSACGHKDGKKALDIREWTCTSCATSHDRDINAAINILNEGLRIQPA